MAGKLVLSLRPASANFMATPTHRAIRKATADDHLEPPSIPPCIGF